MKTKNVKEEVFNNAYDFHGAFIQGRPHTLTDTNMPETRIVQRRYAIVWGQHHSVETLGTAEA